MIATKVDKDNEEAVLCAQAYPPTEENRHNFDTPQECICSPDVWVFYDENGEVEYSTIEHHYMQ